LRKFWRKAGEGKARSSNRRSNRRHFGPAAAAATACRYRSIAAIIAVPVVLIAAVLLLMPRGSPYAHSDFTRSEPFSRSHYQEGGGKGGKGAGADRYAIVIDAGSTGSRVHIFKFTEKGGNLQLQYDKFDQLKPGLSSFADDPPKAAESLAPLLKLAEETVPKEQQAETAIMVGATAGLRLLPDGKADIILEEVRAWLHKHPFKVRAGVRGRLECVATV
jgi:apyrase